MASCLFLPTIPSKFRKLPKHGSQSHAPQITCSSVTAQSQIAKQDLLSLIAGEDRGLKTQRNPTKLASIVKAINTLADLGAGAGTFTTGTSLSATWRLLWTTEKGQLFIINKAYFFGTRASDVLQVIEVEKRSLNNVITFPPDEVFFVRSDIEIASKPRVNFRFTSAVLRGKNGRFRCHHLDRAGPIFQAVRPFYTVIRVVKDVRGDCVVVDRAPYALKE